MSKLDKETLDAIAAAVAEAVAPLAAALHQAGGQRLAAVSLPHVEQGEPVNEGNRSLQAAKHILGSVGVDIPFNRDGSIPFHRLEKAMDDAGLSLQRQTIVKMSLLEGGQRVV